MSVSYWNVILIGASMVLLCQATEECLSIRGHVRCGRDGDRHAGDFGGRRREQEFGLTGHANPVFVKLFDEDRGGPDDWMDDGFASKSGAFQVRGCAADGLLGGSIEPVLYIYHKCKGTPKRLRYDIPVAAINTEYNISREFQLHLPATGEEVDDEYPVPQCSSRRNAQRRY